MRLQPVDKGRWDVQGDSGPGRKGEVKAGER